MAACWQSRVSAAFLVLSGGTVLAAPPEQGSAESSAHGPEAEGGAESHAAARGEAERKAGALQDAATRVGPACVPAAAESIEQTNARCLDAAAKLFWQGHERFEAGAFEAALSHFQQAFALSPKVELLFNMAQAERQLGRCASSKQLYERYLQAEPGEPGASQAQKWLTELACEPAPGAMAPTPAASVAAEALVPEPGGAPSSASAGDGLSAQAGIPAAGGVVPPVPRRSSQGQEGHVFQDAESEWGASRVLGWAALGGSVAAAAGSLAFALSAKGAERELARLRQDVRDLPAASLDIDETLIALSQQESEERRRGQRSASYSAWLGVAAGGLALAGVGLLLLPEAKTSHSTPQLSFGVTPSEAGVIWTQGF